MCLEQTLVSTNSYCSSVNRNLAVTPSAVTTVIAALKTESSTEDWCNLVANSTAIHYRQRCFGNFDIRMASVGFFFPSRVQQKSTL